MPFRLKWPGGKRWLATELAHALSPRTFDAGLAEPFAGGAALFFSVRPALAWIGDTNPDLIATYEAIREAPEEVADGLRDLPISREAFERQKSRRPVTAVDVAVRTIYLNKTSFGGLWRVNRQGEFNVPFGCKPTTTLPSIGQLQLTSALLQSARFDVGDFSQTLKKSDAGAVYLDPPYALQKRSKEVFVRYSVGGFSVEDQGRVATEAARLAAEGRHVLVSNALDRSLLALFDRSVFKAYRVDRPNNFASRSRYRNRIEEMVLLSKSIHVTRLGRLTPLRWGR